MDYDISPGVERAAEDAIVLCSQRGDTTVRLVDWLTALLAEEEGRPYELLLRLGYNITQLREKLSVRQLPQVAPSQHDLYVSAKRHSIRLRGEPSLTTDLILYAILKADQQFATELARLGIDHSRIEDALRSPMIQPPSKSTNAATAEFDPAEATLNPDVDRILDVNMNRARESLRILDDYARFCLNDRTLTEEFKTLRHQLTECDEYFPVTSLQQSRNTRGDVGTDVTTHSEYHRTTPKDVAFTNFKRLQESLRSLEEYGKLKSAPFAKAIEQIRYRAYSLESAVITNREVSAQLASARLYVLLTAAQCVNSLDWIISEAAAGGAGVFQLREKTVPDKELLIQAKRMRKWTDQAKVLFIVNDRPDIALLSDADGVHLGQDDLRVADARRILGPKKIIGVSTHTIHDVRRAILDGATYLGVGPTFSSKTKQFEALSGLKFVTEAVHSTSLPAFVLGGLNVTNISSVVAAGGNRIAVSSAIAEAEEPRLVAEKLLSVLNQPQSANHS
jgi:thiamine-phosphate pyrophosphorylase